MLRIASRRKSVRSGFRNHVELRHGEARLARKTLHHFIEPRYLLPRNPLRATGRKRDLVGEEIRERVHADSDPQAKSHSVPPAKNLPHENEQERESDQQKCCTKDSHSVYSILIVCRVQLSCTNGSVQTVFPKPVRFQPRQQVVLPAHVQSAWRLSGRYGRHGYDRPVTPCPPGSAAPEGPESAAE